MHKNSYDEGARRARVAVLRELEDFIESNEDYARSYNKADVSAVLHGFISMRLAPLLGQPRRPLEVDELRKKNKRLRDWLYEWTGELPDSERRNIIIRQLKTELR